jgi:hypothetical protein
MPRATDTRDRTRSGRVLMRGLELTHAEDAVRFRERAKRDVSSFII